MGAFFQSVAIPTDAPGDVRALVTTWLAAKGFEPRPEPPLFDCAAETERGLCLFANDRWVVVLYSHMDTEGPRLLHELGKLNQPLLRIWVHDSDLWGYDLHQDEELVASFNSHPHYFGYAEELSLPVNGDPALLCELCPVEAGAEAIARIQRGRALFKEVICRRFCEAIGAAPAGLGYRDIEEMNLPASATVPAGGFRMEQWFFVQKGYDGREDTISLHTLSFTPPDEPAAPEEMPPEWHEYARAVQVRVKIIQVLLWPLFFAVGLLLKLCVFLYRMPFLRWLVIRQHMPSNEGFFRELHGLCRPSSRVEGRSLINDRHHCRIDLPEGVEPHPMQASRWVFHFRVGEVNVLCQAVRPAEIRNYFRLPAGRTLVEDEKFFAGPLPARAVVQSFDRQDGVIYQCLYLVQTDQAFYLFSTVTMQEMAAENRALLRDTVGSYHVVT